MGANRLFSDAAKATSFQRYIRGDRIRAQHEHHRVGAGDQRLDALPPFLESVDFAAVDQNIEAARPERFVEPIDEGDVPAGVGNKDLCPGGLVNLFCRSVAHPRITLRSWVYAP
jgi:hypothetical protein